MHAYNRRYFSITLSDTTAIIAKSPEGAVEYTNYTSNEG